MEHEIIIKNGIAGVEINGRFYTHKYRNGYVFRIIDVDCTEGYSFYARTDDGGIEDVYRIPNECMTPIPNPTHEWPAGTKVMVRNSDSEEWVSREFHDLDGNVAYCVPLDSYVQEPWKQCKLAEGV